ncbi:hypothetical protein RRG08_020212 [Elysia crispata]|uniref:Uncharacterized protein n=1 Tax=Elysia crispata TaxID=231223 RepID=A0AAE1DRB0_9GAST|nr:hypothetical protein RRG08_020212 [Elysia crispata]
MLRAANGCSLLSPTVTHSTRQPTLLLLSEPSEPSEPFPPSSYNLTVHRSNMDSRFSMEIRVEGLESYTACSTPYLSLRVADLTLVPNDFSRGQYLDKESALCGSRQHSGGVASGCLTKNHWRLVEMSRAVCVCIPVLHSRGLRNACLVLIEIIERRRWW